jgi:hypothetical protein
MLSPSLPFQQPSWDGNCSRHHDTKMRLHLMVPKPGCGNFSGEAKAELERD